MYEKLGQVIATRNDKPPKYISINKRCRKRNRNTLAAHFQDISQTAYTKRARNSTLFAASLNFFAGILGKKV